jgi:mRNA interferase MazF
MGSPPKTGTKKLIGANLPARKSGSGAYIPDAGDFVWLNFDPQAGHEQRGLRPALVLSPSAYNAKSSLALVCPLTRQIKGYPFEVLVPDGLPVAGAILVDQLRSADWRARQAKRIGRASKEILNDVRARLVPGIRFE